MAAEPVRLADGPAVQLLVDGVAPVDQARRDLADLARRRDLRRQHQPMAAGGLFDETARDQLDLF